MNEELITNKVILEAIQGINQKLDGHYKRFDSIEEILNQHDKRFGSIEEILNQHDKRFDSIEEILNQHDKRFDSIEKTLSQHNDKFGSITRKLTSHDKKFDSIDRKFDYVIERLDKIEPLVIATYEQVGSNMERLSKLEIELESVKDDTSAIRKQVIAHSGLIADHENRITVLEENTLN